MHRWDRSRGRVGVNAPSWLTFEIYRPYFDGGESALTPVQARTPLVAARLFAAGDATAARAAMLMPASFRQLLMDESRLSAYRVARPSELPDDLATPAWRMMADAFRRRAELDPAGTVGLASWLSAVCLPEAVLDVVPVDAVPAECADVHIGLAQYHRALALFQRAGLTPATRAAFAVLVEHPVATLAHMQASGVWSYLSARNGNAAAAADADRHAQQARALLAELAPHLSTFDQALWRARAPLREATLAQRRGDLGQAWELVEQARRAHSDVAALTPEQRDIATELQRRIIDRRVEVAVLRQDWAAEESTIAEGLALDPYCVKIRMQAAQAAQRRGDLATALTGYLLAARLGPFGTAFALLQAASCAGRLGRDELDRVLCERAHRAAPRSTQASAALVRACRATGDEPLAELVAGPAQGYQGNWHYRMYGAYLNLGPSGSPCLYARIPQFAYAFAAAGHYPRVDLQRIMPPAFRTNLARESGLTEFTVSHPEQLAPSLRTPAWDQLCEWVAGYADADLPRQLLTCKLLYHLGFRRVLLDLLPPRPAASLHEPEEFHQYVLRDLARYADSAGGPELLRPSHRFELIDQPECPLYLKFTGATVAVVYIGREKKSVKEAARWKARAAEYLQQILASDELSECDKVMVHSRYYRGVSFLPFLRRDLAELVAEMDLAEEYARAVPASTEWEHFLKRENLHACLESRAKEALLVGDAALAHRRLEAALAVDPYHPMSNIEYAESLGKQGRFEPAAQYYLRAARLGPLRHRDRLPHGGRVPAQGGRPRHGGGLLPAGAAHRPVRDLGRPRLARHRGRGWAARPRRRVCPRSGSLGRAAPGRPSGQN